MNEEELPKAVYVGIGAVVVGSTLYYINVVRTERKKRKQIAAWKEERLICIAKAHARLAKMVQSPDFNFAAFMKAYQEEDEYLNLIINQPMY